MTTLERLYQAYLSSRTVTTDSRAITPGCIFFAFRGEHFDGNAFAPQALEQGAALCVISDPAFKVDDRCIVVPDVLRTLQELACEHRRHLAIPVVGITGTNGKTTTKELVTAVLARRYRVSATKGNFNNHLGVPLTLLSIPENAEMAIVEMGANHPGEIEFLCRIADPDCGLITNVGRAHLQGFGSFEGVKCTKGELYDFLKAHGGLVFLNTANEHLVAMAQERGLDRVVSYGHDDEAEVQGRVVAATPFIEVEWWQASEGAKGSSQLRTHLIGAYNLDNILAAVTVGLHFGLTPDQINHALEQYEPTNNRSELVKTSDNVLIVDAYNANPTSMAAALDSFAAISLPQPKMVIIGDMRELGDVSAEEHQKIVDKLKAMGLTDVWLVGEEFGKTQCAFTKFADVAAVKAAIASAKPTGKCILIKGSNGTRLFELPALL